MYIVKAKSPGDSYGPDVQGGDNLRWIEGQTRLVHEGVIQFYRSNPIAWEIVDSDDSLVRASRTLTGGIGLSASQGLLQFDYSGLFASDCVPAGLATAKTAIAANACTVTFAGDSVTEDGNTIDDVLNYHGTYRAVVMDALRLGYPGCTFTHRNYGLSSRTGANFVNPSYTGQASGPENITTGFYRTAADHPNWGDGTGSTAGKSWLNHVKDSTPHLLFIAFGLNPQMDDGIQAHLDGIKAAVATWTPVPSVVLVAPMRPHHQYQDQRRAQAIGRIYREYAKRNGWSLLDVGRLHNIFRDGFDESKGVWTADNQNLMTWENWRLLSGSMVQNNDNTVTLGANSFMCLDVDAHDVSVQLTAITTNTDATGVLQLRARDEAALAEAGTFPQFAFLRASNFSVQLWDTAGQVGSSYGYTPTAGGDKFRFDLVGASYSAYLNGVLRNSGVSYKNMRAGRIVVGAFGGSSGGMVLTNPKVYYKVPSKSVAIATDADILGAPYSSSDFATRWPHGGNGANHPSSIGTEMLYSPQMRALIAALR